MFLFKVSFLMAVSIATSALVAENKSPKVVVVGAGLAGLTTAYRLQQNGMNVHVYEARGRVGGRVLTAEVGGHLTELGGQNITDGGEAKNMLRLIDEFGLELIENKIFLRDVHRFYFNGERLIPMQQLLEDKKFQPESLKSQLNDLIKTSKNMREIFDQLFERDDPLYSYFAVRLAGYEGATIEKLSSLYADTLYHMLLGGVSTAHSSEEEQIRLLSIRGGNALLPEKLAEKLKNRVHLSCCLKSVSKKPDRSFLLTFDDGQEVVADILVLALPCSVYEKIAFEETVLPNKQLEGIQSVRYGTNAKILVPFPNPPPVRIGFVNDRVGSFFWDDDCHLLILYYTGEASRFSSDTILKTYQYERSMLEVGFGDTCPPMIAPIFAKDEPFCAYEGPAGYSWPNDSYVKGSYAYISPGQEELLTACQEYREERVKTLFAPVDDALYFVGEHASILTDVPGTMEAACESGERIARMILK